MCDAFTTYFHRLEGLSTEELDLSVANLVQGENRSVALMIAHLSEISRRKADLAGGYRNLFYYCVRRLGLSEGSVALRIQVANVARRFPEVLVALAEGRIRRCRRRAATKARSFSRPAISLLAAQS